MAMTWQSFFGGDTGEDKSRQGGSGGWLYNATGIPATDQDAQREAMAMSMLQAAGSMANANRPGAGLGNILASGAAGFGEGLGAQAMMRQRQAVREAQAKMAQNEELRKAQAEQRAAEEHGLKMRSGGLTGDAANLSLMLGRQPTVAELARFKQSQRPVTSGVTMLGSAGYRVPDSLKGNAKKGASLSSDEDWEDVPR